MSKLQNQGGIVLKQEGIKQTRKIDNNQLCTVGLLRALIRENYILKSQVGLLHDMLIEKEILDPVDTDLRVREYVAELSESDYLEYLIEVAEEYEEDKQVH